MRGMAEDALTIRQAAALLNVHPNTVRNRIKSGTYRAEKIITEHGETYVMPRSELESGALDSPPNNLPSASQSQPLPDVREAMQAMLEPFVRELGDVREELGRERERRERAEERAAALEEELASLRAAPGAPETVEEGTEPRSPAGEAQTAPQRRWWEFWR